MSKPILAKITVQNIIACTFTFGYFIFLFSITGSMQGFPLLTAVGINTPPPFDLEESPVITLLLGIMSAALISIIQFYFKRSE